MNGCEGKLCEPFLLDHSALRKFTARRRKRPSAYFCATEARRFNQQQRRSHLKFHRVWIMIGPFQYFELKFRAYFRVGPAEPFAVGQPPSRFSAEAAKYGRSGRRVSRKFDLSAIHFPATRSNSRDVNVGASLAPVRSMSPPTSEMFH